MFEERFQRFEHFDFRRNALGLSTHDGGSNRSFMPSDELFQVFEEQLQREGRKQRNRAASRLIKGLTRVLLRSALSSVTSSSFSVNCSRN